MSKINPNITFVGDGFASLYVWISATIFLDFGHYPTTKYNYFGQIFPKISFHYCLSNTSTRCRPQKGF